LPASVNEYGPNSLVEVRVLAKSSHQPEKEKLCVNIGVEKWSLIKKQRKLVKISRNKAFKLKDFKRKKQNTNT
jgi:hypothetical protein